MKRQHFSRQRWLELVEAQRRSELSVAEFCERHELAVSTFYGWKRRLKDEGRLEFEHGACGSTGSRADAVETPAFVEVTAASQDTRDAEPLELVLRGEVVVRIPRRFDPDTLRQVVEALS